MERRIVRIVKALGIIDRRAAKEDDVVAVKLKIGILESDLCYVVIAIVKNITSDLPMLHIRRAHKR